ncbi:MAG: transposase [Candidatus Diapherotrites archaeon]|nr:transposase [Candidatus Diapherotrites archaeon]
MFCEHLYSSSVVIVLVVFMSWNLSSGDDFLPRVSEAKLEQLYKQENGRRPKLRLLCALHRKSGKSIDKIAELVRIPRRTVHKYLWRFEEKGLDGKNTVKQPGRKPALSSRQRSQLVKELERGVPHSNSGLWDTKEVRELIKKKFGVTFVPQHVWRILVACGFSLQRPRPRHYKTNLPDEIRRFKKKRKGKADTIGQKVLLWAAKTKQPSPQLHYPPKNHISDNL